MMEKIVAHKKSEKAVGDTKKSSARKFTLSSTSHEHIQQLHSSVGNQVVRQLCEQGLIQAKHKISKPNDIYEREADAAAEKVAKGMPVVQVSGLPENGLSQSQEFQPQYNKNETIQSSETRHHPKKVINEIHESITQQEEESEELEEEPPQTQGSVKIQRKLPEAQESSINLNAAIRAMAQSGEGNPLNQDVKQRTEKLFNADFSNVRVHKDYHANMAAKAISARAFTQGTDIYLSSNESTKDIRLMAHELTHTIQQSANKWPAGRQFQSKESHKTELEESAVNQTHSQDVIHHQAYEHMQADDSFKLKLNPHGEQHSLLFRLQHVIPSAVGLIQRSPDLSELLDRRKQALQQQELLYDTEQYIEASIGINPGMIDWQSVIPRLLKRQPFEVVTAVDKSNFYKYQMFLLMLQAEATVVNSPGEDVESLDLLEKTLIGYSLGLEPEKFTEDITRTFSENFLEHWLKSIENVRCVPKDFDIESLDTETSEAEIDDKREAAISKFLNKYAWDIITKFILDQWFLSDQPPEKYLAELDLSSHRNRLIGHLTEKFIIKAKEDPILMGVYRDTAIERTRMRVIRSIYALGKIADNKFNELVHNLYITPVDELTDFEYWVANNPATYADIYSGFAQISHGVLTQAAAEGEIDAALLTSASELIHRYEIPEEAGAILAIIQGLVARFGELKTVIEEQKALARERIAEALDLNFDDIAEVIRSHAEYAANFIENDWKKMLRDIALERVRANRDELKRVYKSWEVETPKVVARFRIAAMMLEDTIRGLREGEYQSVELQNQRITIDDVEQLETAAQFMHDEANIREDPESSSEKKEQVLKAINEFDEVRDQILDGTYSPLDYSAAVYEEARERLGIAEFPEFTMVHSVLFKRVTASENPFLAHAIVHWKWKEGSERIINQVGIATLIGIVTLAALLATAGAALGVVAPAAASIIGAIDIAVAVVMGVKGVMDAYDVLEMAKLDTDNSIRNVSVEQAEEALKNAWIGLAITVVLVGLMAGFLAAARFGRGSRVVPKNLTKLSALTDSDPVLAARLMKQVRDLRKLDDMLDLVGDATRLEGYLKKASSVRDLEYVLMFGKHAELAPLLSKVDNIGVLAKFFDKTTDIKLLNAIYDKAGGVTDLRALLKVWDEADEIIRTAYKGDLRKMVALSRASADELGIISNRFTNFEASSKRFPGVQPLGDYFVINDRIAFINKVEQLFEASGNRLHPILRNRIFEHIGTEGVVRFPTRSGIPGLHAEVRAVNSLLNQLPEGFDLSKINVSTIKLSPGKGQGMVFPACINCGSILDNLVTILTGVK